MARNIGRFSRIKKPLKSEMNVVPYIDVMLVLLVIFMVTAPMITSSINVDLPENASHTTTSQDAKSTTYIVSLDKDGLYTVESGKSQQIQLNLSDVERILLDALDKEPNLNVVIAGDKTIAYGQVMDLMANLQQSGLKQVGLLTQPLK